MAISFQRLAVVAAPFGAIAMLYASLTPNRVLAVIGEMMHVSRGEEYTYEHNLAVTMAIGSTGAVLLSIGMVAAALRRPKATPRTRACLVAAVLAFGAAVLLIAFGDTQLVLAFGGLAAAEIVQPDALVGAVAGARHPMLIGYVLVLVGASAVFFARGMPQPEREPARSGIGCFAMIATLACSFFLCLAAAWSAYSAFTFEGIVGQAANIKPDQLASSVSGILLSIYLSQIGLAGYGLACLLWSFQKTTPEQALESLEHAMPPLSA